MIKKSKVVSCIFTLISILAVYYVVIYLCFSQHGSIDKIYIINLDKSPYRFQKMQEKLSFMKLPVSYDRFSAIDGKKIIFTNHLTKEAFIGQFILDKKIWLQGDFDARCQNTDDINDLILIRNLHQEGHNKRIPGEVGLICGHRRIWQEIVKNGYKSTLIMEDDIKFVPFFDIILNSAMNTAPKDYDLLFLHFGNLSQAYRSEVTGKYINSILTFFDRYIKNPFWKRARKNIMSSQGYILTTEGAKKLLQCENTYAKERFMPIDQIITTCINDKFLISYASKPMLIEPDENTSQVSDITDLNQIK